MKVILTTEVEGVGSKGDVVDVAAGYGRNYLLPKSLAIKATDGALRQVDALRRSKIEAERKSLETAQATMTQLGGTRVVIAAQAGDEGQLFGSIGVTELVEAVAKITGVTLDRSAVTLTTPVKSIGLHEANVKLHPQVEFPLTIDVIPA